MKKCIEKIIYYLYSLIFFLKIFHNKHIDPVFHIAS